MGLLARVLDRYVAAKMNSSLELWRELYAAPEVKSGVPVNWKTALDVTTVLGCARVIADGISTVPLKVFRKVAAGSRDEATDHPLSDLLGTAPNDWQTSLEFRETLAFHLALCGNAFAFVNRVAGRVVELLPIEPGCVTVEQGNDYSLTYKVKAPSGKERPFPAEAIWHIRGASWNSWMGMEPVRLAREAIGLALATEQSQARMHKNGLRPSGLYSVEGPLSAADYPRLKAWLDQQFGGVENAGGPMILDRNAKFTPTTLTGVDAQHIETRKLQIEEICRAMGVLPIMVGFSDKTATYASAEQMFLAHAVHCIRPWHRRFEASIRKNLLTKREREAGFYVKFIDTELLRGAAADRAAYYATALGSGGSPAWMTPNEVRALEEMDAIDGGDELPAPTNLPAPPADAGASNGTP